LIVDVVEHHVKFGWLNDQYSYPSLFVCCRRDVSISDKIVKSDDLCPNDTHMLHYVATEEPWA